MSHLCCRTGGKVQLPGQEIGCHRENWFALGTLAIDLQLFLAPLILDLISKNRKIICKHFQQTKTYTDFKLFKFL